jgi:hypothetical protein
MRVIGTTGYVADAGDTRAIVSGLRPPEVAHRGSQDVGSRESEDVRAERQFLLQESGVLVRK